MKKISFVQVNFQQGPTEFNAFYLPYSVGLVWSYIKQFDHITEKYQFGCFIWRRDPIEDAVKKIKDSDIVGFSCYVWNKNYCYTLAKRYKELNPKGIVIFGGPEPPITRKDLFVEFPFIDIAIRQEGEKTFKKILELDATFEALKSIPGILINDNGKVIDTGFADRIKELDEVPSPYLTGVFDDLMKSHPEIEWNMTLETDRGCPYQCTFCDWGSLTYSKVKKFKLERVFDELDWAGKNKIGFISMTNANFGIFPERDSMIADKIIEIQGTYGWPKTFSTAWAKNQKREVVDIVKKLVHSPHGKNQGLTVSVQSMDVGVLENIKRKNLGINQIREVFDLCNKADVPLYTETILGLPGETVESWKHTYYKLFDAGNHTGVSTFQLQILENTELNLVQKEEYQIKTSTVYDYMAGSYAEKFLPEGINIVVSTKDLPHHKMIEAQVFSWYIMTFHINGITHWISQLLKKQYGVEYSDFYNKFWDFIKNDPWFEKEINDTEYYYANWMANGRADHPNVGDIVIHGYNLIHRTVINIHNEEKYDHIFNLIERFINDEFQIDKKLSNQILLFQKNYLINYKEIKNYPKQVKLDYDFLGYLRDDLELNNPTIYEFIFSEDKDTSFPRFLDNIFYQRRRNYGKALIKKVE
jgi:radical SAM superfamily enzyme YgiQ (UPF0313 family)